MSDALQKRRAASSCNRSLNGSGSRAVSLVCVGFVFITALYCLTKYDSQEKIKICAVAENVRR